MITLLLGLVAVTLGSCGDKTQGAEEPKGTYKVEIAQSRFPKVQRLGRPEELVLGVRNVTNKTIPNLAFTIDSFNYKTTQAGVSDPNRPIWVVDPPPGSVRAQTNTYAFGPLKPGAEEIATWQATPARSGTYTVKYVIAAGLTGKAKARLADGRAAEGSFVVTISRETGIR